MERLAWSYVVQEHTKNSLNCTSLQLWTTAVTNKMLCSSAAQLGALTLESEFSLRSTQAAEIASRGHEMRQSIDRVVCIRTHINKVNQGKHLLAFYSLYSLYLPSHRVGLCIV